MDILSLFGGYESQLMLFVLWSAILYGVALMLERFWPQLIQWSRFWQAWILLALVPLIPISTWQESGLIPQVLIDAFEPSQRVVPIAQQAVAADVSELIFLNYLSELVAGVLVLGTMLAVARFAISLLKTHRIVRESRCLENVTAQHVNFEGFKLGKTTQIRVTQQQVSPFVFGFVKPCIVVPDSVLAMSKTQLNLLIEHEVTHLKNRDPQMVIALRLITHLAWFNPLLRLMEKRFLQAMELECDHRVLSNNPTQQLKYAKALIACLKLTNNKQESGLSAYFSSAKFEKSDFEQRIRAAMNSTETRKINKYYQLALMALVTIMFTSIVMAQPFVMPSDEVKPQQGIVPVSVGRISSDYDEINAFRSKKPHKGIDFAAPTGTEIVASFAGVVKVADDSTLHRNYGKVILLEHQDGVKTLYAHLDSLNVQVGEHVSAGQKIGTVGTTGRVTGPHLHFEMLNQDQRVNPRVYLKL